MERAACSAFATTSLPAAPGTNWVRTRMRATCQSVAASASLQMTPSCSSGAGLSSRGCGTTACSATLSSSRTSSSSNGSNGSQRTPFAGAVLSAVQVLAALQLALAGPALANDNDFRISSQAPGPEAAEEEQFFQTVPQGLAASDSNTAPRLGSLIEGPKGKQIQQVNGSLRSRSARADVAMSRARLVALRVCLPAC